MEESETAWFQLPLEESDLRLFTVTVEGPALYDECFRLSVPEAEGGGSSSSSSTSSSTGSTAAARRPSPYAGGLFRIEVSTPADYPTSPPGVRFLTGIMHPLISGQALCKDVLEEAWREPWEAPGGAEVEVGGLPVHPHPQAPEQPGGGRHLLTLLLLLRKLLTKPQDDYARGLGECKALIHAREGHKTLLDMDAFDQAVRACTQKYAMGDDE